MLGSWDVARLAMYRRGHERTAALSERIEALEVSNRNVAHALGPVPGS